MRIWTIHPGRLDQKRLCGMWKEGLTGLKVIGTDKGYAGHSAWKRFKTKDQLALVLYHVWVESKIRGYNFNRELLPEINMDLPRIPVRSGQILYELAFLEEKGAYIQNTSVPFISPVFYQIPGGFEEWEKIKEEVVNKIGEGAIHHGKFL